MSNTMRKVVINVLLMLRETNYPYLELESDYQEDGSRKIILETLDKCSQALAANEQPSIQGVVFDGDAGKLSDATFRIEIEPIYSQPEAEAWLISIREEWLSKNAWFRGKVRVVPSYWGYQLFATFSN